MPKKLPENMENPIDTWFKDVAMFVQTMFHKLGFTPNGLTVLGTFCNILMINSYRNKSYFGSAMYWILSFFFDVADGIYARTYGMESKFGDKLDHISDQITPIPIINRTIARKIFAYYGYLKC